MQHQHHHRIPRSRSTHAVTRSRTGRACRRHQCLPVPLQRSGSSRAAFVGPVPRSARRWVRIAYLHGVCCARHRQHQHQQHYLRGTNVGTSKAIRSPNALFNYHAADGHRYDPYCIFLIALMADQCSFTLTVRKGTLCKPFDSCFVLRPLVSLNPSGWDDAPPE